jgi:hypothetical protein
MSFRSLYQVRGWLDTKSIRLLKNSQNAHKCHSRMFLAGIQFFYRLRMHHGELVELWIPARCLNHAGTSFAGMTKNKANEAVKAHLL